MSQMPDKIWLHKDTKYSTADTVCGYQYKFLAENEGIENFVEYTRTDAFIEKALKFLDENFFFNNIHHSIESGVFESEEEMFNYFINYVKGE